MTVHLSRPAWFRLKPWLVVVAALVTALALYVHRLMTYGDNLDYLLIAWSTVKGHWLHPFCWRFPVGYPYLLSVWLWLTGSLDGSGIFTLSAAAVQAAKILNVLWVAPVFWAIWRWLREIDAPDPLCVALLLATSQNLMVLFSVIGSEPVFLFCSMLSLWQWEHATQTEKPSWSTWIGLACITLLAIQMRQIGLAIPLAALGYVVFHWKSHSTAWRCGAMASALVAMVFALALMLTTNATQIQHVGRPVHPDSGHWPILDNVVVGFSFYRFAYPHIVAAKLFGSSGVMRLCGVSVLEWPLMMAMYMVLLAGILRVFRDPARRGRLSTLYLAASIAILLVFPGREYRYWPPLLPVLLFLTVLGIRQAVSFGPPRLGRYVSLALLAWIGFQVATDAFAARKNIRLAWVLRDRPPWAPERYEPSDELDFAGIIDAGEWLASHSPSNSLIVCSKALFVQISSRRSTVYPAQIADAVEQSRAKNLPLYLVIDAFPSFAGYGQGYGQAKAIYLQPLMRDNPGCFQLVYESPYLKTKVYSCDSKGLLSSGAAADAALPL